MFRNSFGSRFVRWWESLSWGSSRAQAPGASADSGGPRTWQQQKAEGSARTSKTLHDWMSGPTAWFSRQTAWMPFSIWPRAEPLWWSFKDFTFSCVGWLVYGRYWGLVDNSVHPSSWSSKGNPYEVETQAELSTSINKQEVYLGVNNVPRGARRTVMQRMKAYGKVHLCRLSPCPLLVAEDCLHCDRDGTYQDEEDGAAKHPSRSPNPGRTLRSADSEESDSECQSCQAHRIAWQDEQGYKPLSTQGPCAEEDQEQIPPGELPRLCGSHKATYARERLLNKCAQSGCFKYGVDDTNGVAGLQCWQHSNDTCRRCPTWGGRAGAASSQCCSSQREAACMWDPTAKMDFPWRPMEKGRPREDICFAIANHVRPRMHAILMLAKPDGQWFDDGLDFLVVWPDAQGQGRVAPKQQRIELGTGLRFAFRLVESDGGLILERIGYGKVYDKRRMVKLECEEDTEGTGSVHEKGARHPLSQPLGQLGWGTTQPLPQRKLQLQTGDPGMSKRIRKERRRVRDKEMGLRVQMCYLLGSHLGGDSQGWIEEVSDLGGDWLSQSATVATLLGEGEPATGAPIGLIRFLDTGHGCERGGRNLWKTPMFREVPAEFRNGQGGFYRALRIWRDWATIQPHWMNPNLIRYTDMRFCIFNTEEATKTWAHLIEKAGARHIPDREGLWGTIDAAQTDSCYRFGLQSEANLLWDRIGCCRQFLTFCVHPTRFGHRIRMQEGILDELFCEDGQEKAREDFPGAVASLLWENVPKPRDCWWEDEDDFQCGDPICACIRLDDEETRQLQTALLQSLMAEDPAGCSKTRTLASELATVMANQAAAVIDAASTRTSTTIKGNPIMPWRDRGPMTLRARSQVTPIMTCHCRFFIPAWAR
ncbi:unnamed protein product [Polarella glacialis]|uniref:Uncharacterized protein n=1 Tax=Polarella glacialis TaxID=89957 RepID=A0A813LTX3_POLGL|nr:unnamed protein product [Polarella glacialis]